MRVEFSPEYKTLLCASTTIKDVKYSFTGSKIRNFVENSKGVM